MARNISLTGGLLAVCLTVPAPGVLAATVSGTVVLLGADGQAAKKRDNSGVVVWLEPAAGSPRPV
jgi:hypothetical protein